jgi:hypothetical protein
MIQRMQSVWLLLAALLAFTSLKTSVFSGNVMVNNVKQYQHFTAMNSMPLMILTVGVAIASLISIFLFKDRKLQLKIVIATLAVSLLNIFLYYWKTASFVPAEWTFDLTISVAVAIPVLLILALRGIYKDEQLVKSVDRLR